MKNSLLFIMLVLNLTSLSGQFSYHATDHYKIGSEVYYTNALSFDGETDFSISGENVLWDFSSLTNLNNDTISFFDPNDAGYRFYYCLTNGFIFNCQSKFDELTNLAEKVADSLNLGELQTSDITRHFLQNSEILAKTMLGVTADVNGLDVPFAIEFDIQDTILRFPMMFGNVDSCKSRFAIDLNNFGVNGKFSRDRNRINTVDGYGRLVTPRAEYTEVIRLKTLIFNSDTTSFDSLSIPISTTQVEYKWYAKGYSGTVFEANGSLIGNNEIISNVKYRSDGVSAVGNHSKTGNDIIVFPNPFSKAINIESAEHEINEVHIYNVFGQRVYSQFSDQRIERIEPQLLSGHYFIELIENHKRLKISKIVKL